MTWLSSYLLRNAGDCLNPLILMYHGICSSGNEGRWSVSIDEFNRHLDLIESVGLRPGKISDLANGDPGKGAIFITFDDGLKNNLLAVESLVNRSMVASWYVVTSAIGKTADWEDDKPRGDEMLDWQDLHNMRDAGMELGSHGVQHVRMNDLGDDELEVQLCDSKKLLESRLSVKINSVAYPYGAVDQRVADCAASTGYKLGLTCRSGFLNVDRNKMLLLPRVAVYGEDSLQQFCRKLAFASNQVSDWTVAKYFARQVKSRLAL